ncbi:PLxRFG domain-containing protein [Thauera sp.]|uniref:PLxRFG domain-containing protein n=1 Tax=Thauera sp. TaxID=1905334 RepID=UPI002CA18484|nr:PLxRFG domain-containing protein [Thauera sp.]HRO36696.1 PLxRFG domain-containing protein [Thauera sp.]
MLGTEDKMPRGSVDELGRLHPLPGAPAPAQPQPAASQPPAPQTDWSKFVPDQPAAAQPDWSQFVPDQPREMGIISTLAQGFRNTGRAVGAAADVALDDRASVVERANAQAAAPKNENLRSFESELESRRAALGTDDPGLLDALGVVGGAVLAQPKGAAHAILEQAPNAVAALAPAWAGAKLGATAGAAIPLPGAAPALGVVGGLAGLFLGNTALEVGNKAMEKATDGQFTAAEREAAFQEGGTKAAIITGVDAATLGLSKWIMGATSRAVERATTRALTDAGVDVGNEIAVMAARRSPEMVKAVRQAQEAAIDVTATFGKKAARAGAALGLETVGEGLGEYLGELAATGQADKIDAVLESVLSLGQSGAEVAWGASRNTASMAAARLNPNAGPNSRAAIVALNQQAQGKLPPTEGPAAGTMQQAAAAGQLGGNSDNQPSADWAQNVDAALGTAPAQQDAQPMASPWLEYEQQAPATDLSGFVPDTAPAGFVPDADQNPIETFLGTAPTTTSPSATIDQQDQQQAPRLVPMKDEVAAARRAEVVAKRTGIEQIVIPHPTVPDRFAFVPIDSPLATPTAPTAQAEGLDVEGLFQQQSPIPLKNARNLAGMMSMAGGVGHAVVPAPSGDGFGIAPVDQLSPAQLQQWAGFQPGARRGAARRALGPSAAPTATATPTTSASTTSLTATPQGMPEAGPELAQVTGATPQAVPAAPVAPAVPEGAQGFNTEAPRAAPALPQIENNTFTAAIGNAQSTIRRERWTIDGGRRFEGRIRAELERAGVPATAAQAVIDLAKQQTPTDAFVSGDALTQAARTLGVIGAASTTTTPQQAPQADTQQDKPTTRAIVPGQQAKGRDVLLAQVEQLKQRTAPADLVADYNELKARIADARRRASLKATKRTEAERLTSWADNQDRELERLRTQIGFVELKAGTARYRVLNTPENLEAFAQKLKKAPVGRWTVTVQPEEIYDNVETRAGTTEKQRETGRSAVRELARRITAHLQRRGNHQDRAAIEVLGSRLYDGFGFDGGVDLVGQRVTSAEDLATLAQVFRDPRFETFRVFYTDAQGTVVGEGAYSSRLPAAVNLPNDFDAHIRRDMGRFGATGFWVLHNHPSGRAAPSPADVNLTKWIASSVNGFRGHVVIDHNEFATIGGQGTVQVIQAPQLNGTDFGSKPELDHHMLGSTINGEQDVVQAAKALQVKSDHAALIFLRRDQKVQLVMDVPMALLQDTSRAALGKLRAVVRAFARESGAGGWRFLVLPDGVSPEPLKRLVLNNIFTDIVSADGTTAGNFGAVTTGDFLDYNPPVRRVKEAEQPSRAQTDTAAFRRWFGDSKAVDASGQPLVLYHGTNKDITTFKAGRGGRAIWFAADPKLANMFVAGGRQRMAEGSRKGSVVYPAFLSVQNPLDLGDASPQDNSPYWSVLKAAGLPANYDAVAEIARRNLESGYAGVSPSAKDPIATLTEQYMARYNRLSDILDNPGLIGVLQEAGFDGIKMLEQGATTFAVFKPEQIKSATGNAGTFDPTDPSIVREDAADPYNTIEVRPNTTEAQLDAGRAAYADVQRRILSLRGQKIGAAVLGSRLAADLATTGGAQLIGQEVRDASDLAVLAQIYRNPMFETWRAIYLKDGRIVGENAFTSRLPGAVIIPRGMAARINAEMTKYGADAVFTMHNHPNGAAMPSPGDMNLAAMLRREVPGWRGEVIIDSSEFAVLKGLGVPPLNEFGQFTAPDPSARDLAEYGVTLTRDPRLASVDFTSAPELEHRLLGLPIGEAANIAKLGKGLQVPEGHAAMIVTSNGKVQALLDVPVAPLLDTKSKLGRAKISAMVRRIVRATGGDSRYLVTPKGAKLDRWLVRHGVFDDVVSETGTSMLAAVRKWHGDPDWIPTDQIGQRAGRRARQLYEPAAGPGYDAAPDTRRNRAAEPQQNEAVEDFTPERATVGEWIAHQLKQNRGWAMGALTRDQIADIYGDAMPAVEQFDRTVQAMDLVRNRMMEQADALVERWRKLPSAEADRLADVMHAATLAQFDPAEMNATTPEEQQIAADFDALSMPAQEVYRDVRDQYRNTLINIRDSLAGRAERTGSTGRAIADEIRLKFDRYLQDGPYFSLARFGDFILIADRDGERVVEAFESSLQREKRARGLRAQGFKVKLTAKQQYSATTDGAASPFISDVLEKVDALDMDAEQKGALMDQLNQLAISALPDASYRKHFAHRKGTPGFSNDAMRAFASSQMHAAHHLARIRHADELALLIDEMRADIQATRGDVDTTEQQQVVNELTRRLDLMMNPTTHPVTAALGQVGFVMSLGGSIASGITNLTQTPMVTYPWLGSKFGFDNAAGALLKASKDYFGGRWEKWSGFVLADNPNLEDDERTALRHLEGAGLINLTQASDLAGTANTDSTVSKRAFAINRAMKIVGWTFHTPEVFNRQVSALAAYRLARDAGQAHDTAIESARQALIRTHFDYSASNRARFMSGNVTRVITMFKQYSQNVTYLMWRNAYQGLKGESAEVRREARRMLLGVATMHFAAAGTMGLPLGIFGVTPLLALLSMGMGDEDDPWDWEAEYRNWLADTFGKESGEAIAKGPIRMLLNVDLASRVDLGDLWIRPPQKEAEGRDLVEAWMITLLGPVAGYAGQMGTAAKAFEEGKFARGVEAMLPKFLASPLKAIRYESEGVRSWKGADLGITLSEADIVGTALGFNPARVAEMYEGRSAVKGREARLQARREELTNIWWESQQAGDRTGVAEAFDQIRKFNQRNPAFGITIKTLKQSAMARRRAQLQTSQGYFLNRRRDELREFGRFANID